MSDRRLSAWQHWRQPGEDTPMMIFRVVVALLMLGAILCFAMYIGTGRAYWRQRGLVVVKWTVLAGLGFFAVLILERLALAL